MLDLFERHVQNIRPSGSDQYKGLCPFHDDTKPSFTFSADGLFFCFGCDQTLWLLMNFVVVGPTCRLTNEFFWLFACLPEYHLIARKARARPCQY